MSALTKTIKEAYKAWILINDYTNGIDSSLERITDGSGNNSSLRLSKNAFEVQPQDNDSTSAFNVKTKSGTDLLTVDSTNSNVKVLSKYVNTNIKEFAMDYSEANPNVADTWYGLVSTFNHSDTNELAMGTGSTPSTTLTIASTAYIAVKHYWYVPFNITIDSCNVWFGANGSSGDVVKFSVMSYSAVTTAGSLSGNLSSGIENCVSPATITGAGREQIYYQALTVSRVDVDAGKVICAFVAQDGDNSDLSINMQLVYHLR